MSALDDELLLKWPLKNEGDVNATDNLKQTALHWAAVWGSVAVAHVLLQNGYRVGLDYPEERLVAISAWMNGNGNAPQTIIQNLKIHITETTYGPFRSEDALGRLTELRIPPVPGGGKIVGLFRRAGS